MDRTALRSAPRTLTVALPRQPASGGNPGARADQDGFYGGGSPEFFRVLAAWRERGDLEGTSYTPENTTDHLLG